MYQGNLKIKDVYDLAMAFITDSGVKIVSRRNENGSTDYEFSRQFVPGDNGMVYTMVVTMPCGQPETKMVNKFNHKKMKWECCDVGDKKCGLVSFYKAYPNNVHRQGIMTAQTENNVSLADRAMGGSDLSRALVRVRSPRFFALMKQIQARLGGQVKIQNNAPLMDRLLWRAENNQLQR